MLFPAFSFARADLTCRCAISRVCCRESSTCMGRTSQKSFTRQQSKNLSRRSTDIVFFWFRSRIPEADQTSKAPVADTAERDTSYVAKPLALIQPDHINPLHGGRAFMFKIWSPIGHWNCIVSFHYFSSTCYNRRSSSSSLTPLAEFLFI